MFPLQIMIDGVNDQPEHSDELVELLKDRQVLVNLIPFNQFDPYSNWPAGKPLPARQHPALSYRPSQPDAIVAFAEKLVAAGIKAYERRPHGRDIRWGLSGYVIERDWREKSMSEVGVLVCFWKFSLFIVGTGHVLL